MGTAGDATVRMVVGMVLFGLGAIGGVLLAFYAVGLSEDRDRARGGRGPYDGLSDGVGGSERPRRPPPRRRGHG